MNETKEKLKVNEDSLVSVAIITCNDNDIITDAIREIIEQLYNRFVYYELLIVDNGSVDGTIATIRELQKTHPNIRLLVLSREYNPEIATAAALDHSIGDYIVLLDIEYDPPALISQLLEKAITEHYDVVIAERQDRKENTWVEKFFAHLFYKLYINISGFYFSPNASNFRVLNRRAVNSITQIRSKSRYLKYFNAFVGFKQTSIPYTRQYRRTGSSQKRESFFQQLSRGMDLILSNSVIPLRLVSMIGMLASFLNLLSIVYVFIVPFFNNHVAQGWTSTTLMNAVMFFLLFVILTVMSEYILRILIESKDQPLYFIAEEHNSTILAPNSKKINVVE